MAVDWAAISGFGVGGLTLFAGLIQSRRGERAADRDNRFEVLQGTVDQLQEEVKACRDRETAAETRYRQQDHDLDEMRERHRETLQLLDEAHDELRTLRLENRRLRREIEALKEGRRS